MNNKMKFLIGFMLLLATTMPAKAQTLRDYIRSRAESSDSLLIKAITSSLSIIRQQYRLESKGEYFGKNNQPFYGETYTLGVKVAGATIIQNRVIRPWENDADYNRVHQSGNYKPVRFWSYQRSLSDTIFRSVDLDLESDYTRPIDKDGLLYRNEDVKSDFGLSIDASSGHKSGYMIWAYSSTNVQDSAMHVFFRQSPYQLQAPATEADIQMVPDEPGKVIGGLFVVPVFEPGGRIRLTVVGIASKSSEEKWVLHLFTEESAQQSDSAPAQSPNKHSNKQKNEEEASSVEPTPVG